MTDHDRLLTGSRHMVNLDSKADGLHTARRPGGMEPASQSTDTATRTCTALGVRTAFYLQTVITVIGTFDGAELSRVLTVSSTDHIIGEFKVFSIVFMTAFYLLHIALDCYGIWFWYIGVKTTLTGWMRVLHIIVYNYRIISDGLEFLFILSVILALLLFLLIDPKSIPEIVRKPEKGRLGWIAWVADSNPWRCPGFIALLKCPFKIMSKMLDRWTKKQAQKKKQNDGETIEDQHEPEAETQVLR
ncbi:hypothetical protein B0H67DRAFT_648953 [Lasiosphaeris hirsuta]|uniref:Uncharacterized protein n=1 Tax=Lasiosphaeris hirsuta TaxID=260670 RepID=A0AA40DIK5_9PEZI|nr:hypothetical protein B0H67DRAFT_648953 [Lasiosphaeris hirsuta]